MRFYRLRQWLGIIVTLSLLLQAFSPVIVYARFDTMIENIEELYQDKVASNEAVDTHSDVQSELVGPPFMSQMETTIPKSDLAHSDSSIYDSNQEVSASGELILNDFAKQPNSNVTQERVITPTEKMTPPVPSFFIPNVGQYGNEIGFEAQSFTSGDVAFNPNGLSLSLPIQAQTSDTEHPASQTDPIERANLQAPEEQQISLEFLNASPNVEITGTEKLPGYANYYLGNDPAQWRTHVSTYEGVVYRELYPGIDLYYDNQEEGLKGTYIVSPGAVPEAIQWIYTGIDTIQVDTGSGDLILTLANDGDQTSLTEEVIQLTETAPIAWQEVDGQLVEVDIHYNINPDQSVSFDLGEYNPTLPLTIDPTLIYTTTLSSAHGYAVAVNENEEAYVILGNSSDIKFTKISASGTISYTTFIGGGGTDVGYDIVLGDNNEIFITGETSSSDTFPIVSGFQTNFGGGDWDAVALRLNDAGTLLFSTYIGGAGTDTGYGIDLDDANNVYITGRTNSDETTFPVTPGAFDTTYGGNMDGFVVKLNTSGTQNYGAYLGNGTEEEAGNIVVDDAGRAHVIGSVGSGDSMDVFVAKVNALGTGLDFYETIGGSGKESLSCGYYPLYPDAYYKYECGGIALDSAGNVFISGYTESSDFPTINALDDELDGDIDAFFAKYSATGNLIFASYLGGKLNDVSIGLAVNNEGDLYITGLTDSLDFPSINAWQGSYGGGVCDIFLTKVSNDGQEILYSTFYGGSLDDFGTDVKVDDYNNAYITGQITDSNSSTRSFVGKFNDQSSSLFFGQDWNVECPFCNVADTQKSEYGINTRTGNFGHMDTALSLPTAGGSLDFRYGYISEATDMYTTTMGHGWVHNHELQLHISDPSPTHTIVLQAPGGSRFPYYGNGDGTYERYPGVTADMVYNSGPDEYVVTTFNQYVFTFNGDGQLEEQKDPFGNLTTFSYLNGKLHQAVQGSRSLTYNYNGDELSFVQDDTGRTVTLGYTGNDLTSVTGPNGQMTYQYSQGANLLTDVIDPSGRTLKHVEYDSNSRAYQLRNGHGDLLVDITFPQGATASPMMSSPSAMTASYENLAATVQVEVNGVTMTHVYNSRGVLTDVTYDCTDGTPGCGTGSDTGYDYNFKQTALQDANGNPTALRWNEGGSNIEYVVDALGNDTNLSYDSFNNLTQTVDARGITTTLYYENPTFPTFRTRTENVLGQTHYYTPTVAGVDGAVGGLLKEEQDTAGVVTTYQYNDQGQILETVRAAESSAAVTTLYGYDDLGRLITTTQSAGDESHTSINVYNSNNRLKATISNWVPNTPGAWPSDPDAWIADCDTSAGVRDTNICTRYGYDAAGRTISTTNTLGQTSLSFYDEAGRAYLSVNNWNGSSYSEVTALNDLCDFANPDPEFNLCSLTEYDNLGRVFTTTNSIGEKSVTEYDTLGRVKSITENWDESLFPFHDSDSNLKTFYRYDDAGNRTVEIDVQAHWTRTYYDSLNRVIGTIEVWDNQINLNDCFQLPARRNNNICSGYVYDEVGNTIIVTDTFGQMTRTFYDDLNRTIATVSNWDPQTLTEPEDCIVAANNLQDKNICTLYGYDDVTGNQITTTNALNQTSLTVYDAANRPYLTVQNWDGTPINSEADCQFPPAQSDTNLCSVTYFDVLGRRSSSKNPMGQLSEVDYDDLGRVITNTQYLDGIPVTQLTSYDALGNRFSSTDAEQNTSYFLYDSLNRLQTTTSAAGVQLTQDYNSMGWVITTTNSLDHNIVNQYDLLGRRISRLDAENNLTQYEYNTGGFQIAQIDAEGIVTRYSYSSHNHLDGVMENWDDTDYIDQETNVWTEYFYDVAGNRLGIWNALTDWDNNRVITATETIYDDFNRPIVVTDALGIATYTQYNALGYPVVITDGNGAVTTYAYDGLNRVTDVSYLADGETVSTEYNALGQRLSMTDANGTTWYEYDDLNRLTVVTDTFGALVRYGYDLNGNRTQLVYPDGRTVTYTYDADNRLDTLLDWSDGLTDYDYDEVGRLITTTLPNGVVSVNGYDNADRLTSLRYVDDGGNLLAEYLYELDGVGNRTVVTETLLSPGIVETVEAFLEENGQLVLEAESATTIEVAGQGWLTKTAQSGYAGDSYLQALPDVGQRTEDATNSPQAQFTVNIQTPGDYTVWARGMASDAGGDSLLLSLDGDGSGNSPLTGFTDEWNWTKLTMVNADASLALDSGVHELTAAMREDGLRLDKLLLTTDSTVPSGSGPAESASQTITTTNTASQLGTHVITYDYDPLYRLAGAVYSGDISASYDYAYDAVGNMEAYTETIGAETSIVNRTFNDANQLIAATDSVNGTTSYYYDDNGNMVQVLPPGVNAGDEGEQLYNFNQRNLLASNSVGSGSGVYDTIASFVYDGNGDRIQHVDHSGDTPITTTYTNDIMGLTQVLVANDGSVQVYSLLGLDLISQDDGTDMRMLLVDGLGSVRQEMAAGEVETTSTYNPYGTILAQTGTSDTVYGYTGEQEDNTTGLVYLRARYYSPALQVFMGKDPWRGDKMRPITQHGYVYGHNSPPNFNDPSGLCVSEGNNGECLPPDRDPYGLIEFGGEPGERGTWTPSEKYEVNRAAIRIGKNLANLYNEYMFGLQAELSDHFAGNDYLMSLFNCGSDLRPLSIRQAFLLYYGKPALFYKTGRVETYYGEYKGAYSNNENEIGWPTPRINVNKYNYRGDIGYRFDRVDYGYRWATHELGHYFEARINDILGTNHVRDQLSPEIQNRHGFADDYPGWQQSTCNDPGVCKGEIFADMFLGWNYNKWATRPGSGIPTDDAVLKSEFMDQNMAPWIALVINRERGNR